MEQFKVGKVVFPAGYDKHDKWAFLSSSTAEAKAKWLDDGAAVLIYKANDRARYRYLRVLKVRKRQGQDAWQLCLSPGSPSFLYRPVRRPAP